LVKLNKVDHATDVGIIDLLDPVDHGIGELETLILRNIADKFIDVVLGQLVETYANELVFQRFVDLADVVTDETEPDVVTGRLEKILESLLGVLGHVVDLVEDDEF
jgi:hypothetical protein